MKHWLVFYNHKVDQWKARDISGFNNPYSAGCGAHVAHRTNVDTNIKTEHDMSLTDPHLSLKYPDHCECYNVHHTYVQATSSWFAIKQMKSLMPLALL
jgi:hypothetical protein